VRELGIIDGNAHIEQFWQFSQAGYWFVNICETIADEPPLGRFLAEMYESTLARIDLSVWRERREPLSLEGCLYQNNVVCFGKDVPAGFPWILDPQQKIETRNLPGVLGLIEWPGMDDVSRIPGSCSSKCVL
jgi:hypothetical protein